MLKRHVFLHGFYQKGEWQDGQAWTEADTDGDFETTGVAAGWFFLQQNIGHGFGTLFHSGQTHVESLDAVRESFVVDPHAMQDRRIQVIDVHRILGHVVAKVIG